jgi:tripartite-type tricarboxylate transporter receptor subunit TctC
MLKIFCIGIALLAAVSAAPVAAQDAWMRAVRPVVPSSTGGGSDFCARLLAQGLAQALKQQFIVNNRPGGSGNIGAKLAVRAPADSYTFLVASSMSLVINASLYKNLAYNVERDFTTVTRVVISPSWLPAIHQCRSPHSVRLSRCGSATPGNWRTARAVQAPLAILS